VGLAFNEMSHNHPDKVVNRTREYILLSSHWSSSDTFADKTFNLMFEERFDWILQVLKDWTNDENKWIRNTAVFALHAPVERKLLNSAQYLQVLEVMDQVMKDNDKNVKKKAAWALKVMGKYYPEETFSYLMKCAEIDNKNSKWIVKNSVKFLDEKKRNKVLKAI
jgi:3-methyladenine DNA glycosylase AlkD